LRWSSMKNSGFIQVSYTSGLSHERKHATQSSTGII
jgi:hypothetical protein